MKLLSIIAAIVLIIGAILSMRVEIIAAVSILLIGFIINEFRIVDMRNGHHYDLRKFHLFRLHNGIKYERFILLGIVGLYLLYILAECAFNDSMMFDAIPIQFLAAGVSLVTYYVTYSKMFEEFHEYIMIISLAINSLFLIMVCISRTDAMTICNLPTPGLFLVLVCCYTIPIKFKTALVGGIVSSLFFIAVPIYYGFIEEAFYMIAATITLNIILSLNAYNSILRDKESFGCVNLK